MAKPQRFCIFCGGSPLTREHVWADWIKRYVPHDMQSHTLRDSRHHPDGVKTLQKKISGDPRGRKLKNVCRHCNNHWMSRLQERAKPSLLPMILGRKTKLRRSHQILVAAWASMGVMVAEYLRPDSVTVTQDERNWLRKHRAAPDNWKIWIGHFERRDWLGQWSHNVIPVSIAKNLSEGDVILPPAPNTQETAFVVGKLYVYAFSSEHIDIVRKWEPDPEYEFLFRVWPIERNIVRWPNKTMTDDEADAIANGFWNTVTPGL